MEKGILILLRHGVSVWNEKNLFTGWVDIPLSEKGVEESIKAGEAIAHLEIDIVFTSKLIRAQMTAMLAMLQRERVPCIVHEDVIIHDAKVRDEVVPVRTAWQLNERMYGQLQGMNKDEMREKFGREQVHLWRRSFDEAPPEGESLKMTCERTLPYFQEEIVPFLDQGKNVFVSAHGNSLRSIVMHLENLSSSQVVELEIPTGIPWIYEWKEGKWRKS
jgi:2,3-bisphosphoglycerate-dependent phosphoglycerate mutase